MPTRKGRLAGAAVIAALGMTAAACSGSVSTDTSSGDEGQPVKGGTLNALGTGDTDYMDPNITYYTVGAWTVRPISRQLFTFPAEEGKTTTATPDLATEIPTADNGGVSSDGKTVTITMRDDAMWNTDPARAVTAGDAVRGLKRTCNPKQPFGGIPDFADLIVGYQDFCDGFSKVKPNAKAMGDYISSNDISGATAQDDTTLVFKLSHPAAYFVDMLTMPAFSPAPEEYNNYVPASPELAKNFISDGPYQLDNWEPTKKIEYSRNPAWEPSSDPIRKAYVDKIVVNETVSQESVYQQLQTGTPSADIAYASSPPPSILPKLIASKDSKLDLGDTSSSNPYVVYNTESPNNKGALGKTEVRQALSYGINRDNIIQVLGGPKTNPPLDHVIPEVLVGGEKNMKGVYPYDPDKAKQMLADAGYPNGFTIKFLYRNASEGSSKAFQTIQQDLSKIGVKVKGVPSPDADFYTKYLQVPDVAKRGVWDLALAGWGADWYGNAALSYFNPLFSGKPSFPPVGSNFGLYDSDATNAAIDAAVQAESEDEAATLWAKADDQVMKDAAFFPITNPKQANYHAAQVHNAVYVPSIQFLDPTNIWLEKGKQGG